VEKYILQEKKYLTGQRNKDIRDENGKVIAEAKQRARRQYKGIKNSEKLGKQDRKRCEEQGRKTIVESERINISQRRLIGKWKERTREETEKESTVTEEEESGRSKRKRRCKKQYEKKIINIVKDKRKVEFRIACHNINRLKNQNGYRMKALDWAEEEEISVVGIVETNILNKEAKWLFGKN
ncbi:22284_t:CDS:2, partial [Gigaspora rosea]